MPSPSTVTGLPCRSTPVTRVWRYRRTGKPRPGNGQAAFDLVRLEVLAVFQHGVDDVTLDAADPVGEDAQADADLGCGQAGALDVLHGFGHVGDELCQFRPEFRHGIGDCAQHRIPDDADIQNGHVQSVLTVGG